MALQTRPRQIRLLTCAILSPGLSQRAQTPEDAQTLTSGINIIPYVQRIDIFEDLFNNTISGSLVLLENVGLMEYIPIVGVETIALSFAVDNEEGLTKTFSRSFRVVKVENISYLRNDYRLYTLQLVTHEFVTNASTRLAEAFTNVTCQDAVKTILQKSFGLTQTAIITDEATFGTVSVVIPNYTPLQAINFFVTMAQTTDTKESNFLFFETLDGFHFTSIRKLITDGLAQPMRTFTLNPGELTTQPTVADQTARNAAIRLHQTQTFDLLHDIASGTLRSQMIHFDFLAKKIVATEDSRYTDTFANSTHLESHPFYPKNYDRSIGKDVRLFMIPTNVWTADSPYVKSKQDTISELRLYETIPRRNRQLKELKHIQTLVDLPGQPDLRAGSVVRIHYPSTRVLHNDLRSINVPIYDEGTPYFSGPHVVTSVHHILAQQGNSNMDYRMNLRVCKDSLAAALIGTDNQNDGT